MNEVTVQLLLRNKLERKNSFPAYFVYDIIICRVKLEKK